MPARFVMFGAWRTVDQIQSLLNREYKRDAEGQFSSSGGDDDFEDDPNVGELDEGDFGFGRDPSGESYSEFDVDDEGSPQFSAEYREKYGPLELNSTMPGAQMAVAEGSKRGMHIADDSAGPMNRRVVQEFSKKEAHTLGDGVYAVYSGDKPSHTSSGVTVKPAGLNPTRAGVEVTFADGTQRRFDGEAGDDEAFQLQEVLDLA